ncbi:MAG: polysaccharide lyase family protein [Luteolibacter sp.]
MMRRIFQSAIFRFALVVAGLLTALPASANIPGGGTGTGANITLTGTATSSTTSTMSNGIVSIICAKSSGQITTINYTFNNTGASQTLNLLSGNSNGGKLYWEQSQNQGLAFTYSVVADPSTNGGDYAEIALSTVSEANMPFEVHYSMRRGSPGFYVTAIWTHNSTNLAYGMGECRDNIYAGGIFNWMSVDDTRNKLMQVTGGTSTTVPTAPVECSLWTSGMYQGRYEDKYKYSASFGDQRVWGWSSVGASGKNVGLWNVLASAEYYNGGPLKQELMCHMGTTILNMINGNHFGMGTDGTFVDGETWSKVCGPYFIYCNNISKTNAAYASDTVAASQALYNDAKAQALAEQGIDANGQPTNAAGAWPYSWFSHASYASPANRGKVTGKIVINDSFNPNATAANLWVGLIRQPVTSTGTYDFQQWMKPYQFWVHADVDGNFTIPAAIAGSNYTLYAFGQGATGTFMSQPQTGGNPPYLYNVPAVPFSVTVTGGATTALGNVTWTPTRVGPTVFEIGYPDRTGRKFKHGEDWWVGDIGPSPTSPSPVWSKFLEFPYDFPNGLNYSVGASRWSTDWNFAQPVVNSTTGTWNSSSSTITFNLASTPAAGTQSSLFLGLASDYYTALVLTVNGTNLGSTSGVTATPSALPSTGFVPTSSRSDSTIRESINGAFSDERVTFPGTLLKAGANTITIAQRQVGGTYFANHAMYDYLRLELTNFVPPAPASVTAYSGNNSVLLSWPAVAGATSYKILRSIVSGSGYASLATGVTGPVCGSGPTNATYVDNTAVNGTTYYYVVQSTNPVNSSVNSTPSTGVTPSSGASIVAPAAPTGLVLTPGNAAVTLNWTASPNASYYTIKRSTLTLNGGNSVTLPNTIPLNTITLNNAVSGTSYTDTSPTNGSLYSYTVSAANSAGATGESTAASTTPAAVAPASAPATLTATAQQNANAGGITLNWPAVSGAVGYVVQRATAAGGPYTYLGSLSALTYTNTGLAANTTCFYQVAAMNSGGTSAFITASATTPPAAPANLVATAGNSKVTLSWSAATGATSYVVGRATVAGGPYSNIASGVATTTYVDSTAGNGTTYYYVVAATGAGGTGLNSAPASAIPVGVISLVWNGNVSTTWDSVTANWLNGAASATYSDGGDVTFDDTATNKTAVVSGTVSPDAVLFENTAAYTFTAAGLSGTASLTKLGTGTVTISGVNTYTGGSIIGAGTVVIAGATAANGQNGLGGGTVTLQGGTLTLNGYTGSTTPTYGNLANAISVPQGSTGTIRNSQRGGITGNLTGGGSLTLQINYIRGDVGGDWSAFTGNINVIRTRTGTNVDNFRINSNTGFGTAAINLGPYVQASTVLNADNNFVIGELSGDAASQLAGVIYNNNTPGAYSAVYQIGGRDTDATFAGSITNGANPSITAITKEGIGNWTLTGASTYGGATNVTNGTLTVAGSLANTSSVSVQAAAFLALSGGSVQSANIQVLEDGELDGNGTLTGPVTNAGTIVRSQGGTLTVNGGVTNTGTIRFDAGAGVSSGLMAVNGNLSLAGTVQIVLAPGTAMGRYPLFTYTGTLAPVTAVLGGIPGSTTAKLSTSVAGRVDLIIDDSDEDGLPDSWEMQYFGDLASGPAVDPDGDGQNNSVELLTGTNPASGASLFAATIGAPDSTHSILTWPSVPGKSYQIQTSATLSGAWGLLVTVPAAASPATNTGYTVTRAAQSMFYRIALIP